MRISDWSSDVCSSDLPGLRRGGILVVDPRSRTAIRLARRGRMSGGGGGMGRVREGHAGARARHSPCSTANRNAEDRKSVVEGKSVSVRVHHGGRRSMKNKKENYDEERRNNTRQ